MADTVRQAVDSSEYASTNEVIRGALRDWTCNRNADLRDI
jgi:antitoxin ParD1/3/4